MVVTNSHVSTGLAQSNNIASCLQIKGWDVQIADSSLKETDAFLPQKGFSNLSS